MSYILMKIRALIIISLLFGLTVKGQDYDGYKGQTGYQKYDKTYINPSYRGKHSPSMGFGVANLSPWSELAPQAGGHLGYNYLIMYKRRRIFGVKETVRDEIKMGFGAHFHIWANNEWYLNFNYLNPLFSIRGKALGWYFFGEYGLGLHRSPQKLESPPKTSWNLSIEPLRIKFGKTPLNLNFTFFYNIGNALLSQQRMDLAAAIALRYYFYKKK